jgi:acetyltransferase-like isoleucine patch superfamily enzyme
VTADLLTPLRRAGAVVRTVVYLRAGGVRHGPLPCFRRKLPRLVAEGRIVLGEHFYSHGVRLPAAIEAYGDGELLIGDRVRMSGGVGIYAHRSVVIGDDCRLGELSTITDSNLHEVEEGAGVVVAPVRLGRNVWLGRGAVVLAGVTIGDHSVVGANSVVTGDIPSRTLAAGNPARPVRVLSAGDGWRRH